MYGQAKCIQLSSGYQMPLVGFGTFRIRGRDVISDVIDQSLHVGFRSIDTAAVYGNEEDIGVALKKLLPKYNLKREDFFITSKLAPSDNGSPEKICKAVRKSLHALGIEYLDLFLIHWPGAAGIPENSVQNRQLRAETWKTLIDLQKQGWLRSIGVSNYTIKHLRELLQDCSGVKPVCNQVECHPHYCQKELLGFCRQEGIHLQAYSSLGTSESTALLRDPVVCKIAHELSVSPAQVLLKWALQQEIGIIPKATKKNHIRENINLNFIINNDQMKALSSLPQNKYAWNPDNVH